MSEQTNLQRRLCAAFRGNLKDAIDEDILTEVGKREIHTAAKFGIGMHSGLRVLASDFTGAWCGARNQKYQSVRRVG
jgi:hypothetical protein